MFKIFKFNLILPLLLAILLTVNLRIDAASVETVSENEDIDYLYTTNKFYRGSINLTDDGFLYSVTSPLKIHGDLKTHTVNGEIIDIKELNNRDLIYYIDKSNPSEHTNIAIINQQGELQVLWQLDCGVNYIRELETYHIAYCAGETISSEEKLYLIGENITPFKLGPFSFNIGTIKQYHEDLIFLVTGLSSVDKKNNAYFEIEQNGINIHAYQFGDKTNVFEVIGDKLIFNQLQSRFDVSLNSERTLQDTIYAIDLNRTKAQRKVLQKLKPKCGKVIKNVDANGTLYILSTCNSEQTVFSYNPIQNDKLTTEFSGRAFTESTNLRYLDSMSVVGKDVILSFINADNFRSPRSKVLKLSNNNAESILETNSYLWFIGIQDDQVIFYDDVDSIYRYQNNNITKLIKSDQISDCTSTRLVEVVNGSLFWLFSCDPNAGTETASSLYNIYKVAL